MISSLQSTGSDVFTDPRDRRRILDSEWIVNDGQTEQSGSEASHRKGEVNTPKVDRKAGSTLIFDSEVLIKTFQILVINDPVFSATVQAAIDREIEQFRIEALDSSTTAIDLATEHLNRKYVSKRVQQLFSLASFLDLEPGMENAFSIGLENAIERHGESALSEIQSIILEDRTKSSIAMEALQYIGRMNSHHWKTQRRKLLEQCLLHSRSAWVRDGAGLGLASLDDPRSMEAVRVAIAKESSKSLKKDLESVLEQLEDTRSES